MPAASASQPGLPPVVEPASVNNSLSTMSNEQVMGTQVHADAIPQGQSKHKTTSKKGPGGKRKRGQAAPEDVNSEVQARPQKGKKVPTRGTVATVGAPPEGSITQRRVTRATTGATKNIPQADKQFLDGHKSSNEDALLQTITAAKSRPNIPHVGGASTQVLPKTKKPAPKRRRIVVEEDPFETNDEGDMSTAESNKNGEDHTSGHEEDGSDSEDGLGGDNVGDVLTAEASTVPPSTQSCLFLNVPLALAQRPTWNDKATSVKGKGKAVEKPVSAYPKRTPKAPVVKTRRLMLETVDISSGSEFEPEDEEAVEEEGRDEEDEEERQAWAEFLAARAARAKNKPRARPPTAREQVERPVWKNNTTADPASSTSSLQPTSSAPPVPGGPIFDTIPALTSASTNEAGTFQEDEDGEDEEDHFGPDDDVIGGLIMDPTAPAPVPQPIPPIVVPLLPPAPAPIIPALAAHPLPILPPQPNIPDVLPPQAYVIVPNPTGGAPLLNPQNIHVVRTIKAAIPLLELYLVTELAFPDAFAAGQFISTTLVTCAAKMGLTGLVARQTTDPDFLRVMVTLTRQRISTFRSALKKNADAHVNASHGIGSNPQKTQEKVSSLCEHLRYIYPYTEKDNQIVANWKKPYLHDCVAAVLRATFATGPNSLIAQHPEILQSTNPERPNEREIPMVMLALVGTAIHAALSDWKLGTHKPASFTADAYLDVYKEHIAVLEGIKKGGPNKYHRMTHKLYNQASGVAVPAMAVAAPGTALAHVDIQGMDDDSDSA